MASFSVAILELFLNNSSSKKTQRGLVDSWLLPGGIEPDPRFTLANERTFLAWIRTSFALIAGAIALKSGLFDNSGVFVTVGSIALGAVGVIVSVLALHRWRQVESAMRHQRPLPVSPLMIMLSLSLPALVVALCVVGR